MKVLSLPVMITVALLFTCCNIYADFGLSLASGSGTNQSKPCKISIQKSWNHKCFTANKRKVYGYWEASFARVNAKKIYTYPTNHNVQIGSISAAVRLLTDMQYPIFLDLGLGVAYFSKQSIAARSLGSEWLFEDRLGVGMLFGKRQQFEVGYRFIHYSNAYMAAVNNGLNLQLLVLGYWFE